MQRCTTVIALASDMSGKSKTNSSPKTCRHFIGAAYGVLQDADVAARFPACRITSVSNSASQRAFIEGEALSRGLSNLTVITADMNVFDTDKRFDRIVSVEMFEHMSNWQALLERARG